MNQKQKVVICTLKSWNLAEAARFKLANKAQYDVTIISEKASLNREVLEHIAPNYLFFPHWSSIIPKEIYENHRCVVFHMTDLPYGRGGSPLQNLISRGIQETVITAIRAVQVLDGGEVYLAVKSEHLSCTSNPTYSINGLRLISTKLIQKAYREMRRG